MNIRACLTWYCDTLVVYFVLLSRYSAVRTLKRTTHESIVKIPEHVPIFAGNESILDSRH